MDYKSVKNLKTEISQLSTFAALRKLRVALPLQLIVCSVLNLFVFLHLTARTTATIRHHYVSAVRMLWHKTYVRSRDYESKEPGHSLLFFKEYYQRIFFKELNLPRH